MTLTQAVAELLCTSSPQQRLTILSISLPSAGDNIRRRGEPPKTKSLVCVLSLKRRQFGVLKRLPRHTFLRAPRHQASPTSARRQLHFHAVGVARPGPWVTFLQISFAPGPPA